MSETFQPKDIQPKEHISHPTEKTFYKITEQCISKCQGWKREEQPEKLVDCKTSSNITGYALSTPMEEKKHGASGKKITMHEKDSPLQFTFLSILNFCVVF